MNGTGLKAHGRQKACELDDFQAYMITEASMLGDNGFNGLCIPHITVFLSSFLLQTWEIVSYVK